MYHSLAIQVERQLTAQRIGQDRAARAQRMPNADFIPDIWVIDGEVGNDQLSDQKVLKHVGMNGAAAPFRIGATWPQPGRLDCWLQVVPIDPIEVDIIAVRPRLAPEGHYKKGGSSCHVE